MTSFTPSPLQKSLGLTQCLTFNYQQMRSEAKFNQPKVPSFNVNDQKIAQVSLLQRREEIEFSQRKLPPAWVDVYDKITENIQTMARKNNQLKHLQKERLNITWGDTSSKDKEINLLSNEISQILKQSENKLQQIKSVEGSDKELKNNIQKSIACQIKECASNFRKQQSDYISKVKQIQGEDTQVNFFNYDEGEQDTQEFHEMQMIARVRDESINKLIDSVNDLATLFKELQVMVVEQGTILDRIDYNIEIAVSETDKANVELEKARNYQKSMRSTCCMMILISLISLFVILLIFKHS